MCAFFSKLMSLNKERMGPARYEKARQAAIGHLEFALDVYRLQIAGGRYFLHEHPLSATSWNLPQVQQLILEHDLELADLDMCTVGMEVDGKLVQKSTRFMTNAPCLASVLKTRCNRAHDHTRLIGGTKSHRAQNYPPGLCRRIVQGLRLQLEDDARVDSGDMRTFLWFK